MEEQSYLDGLDSAVLHIDFASHAYSIHFTGPHGECPYSAKEVEFLKLLISPHIEEMITKFVDDLKQEEGIV